MSAEDEALKDLGLVVGDVLKRRPPVDQVDEPDEEDPATTDIEE
jgi:hypothetical protein